MMQHNLFTQKPHSFPVSNNSIQFPQHLNRIKQQVTEAHFAAATEIHRSTDLSQRILRMQKQARYGHDSRLENAEEDGGEERGWLVT